MEIFIVILILILLLHWLGDFVFQSDRIATGKSKDFSILMEHIGVYGFVFVAGLGTFQGLDFFHMKDWGGFLLVTLMLHLIIDYFTSKINAWLYLRSRHWFFTMIGFDQLLHMISLILALEWFL